MTGLKFILILHIEPPNGKAHVHCIVVGFSVAENSNKKIIFAGKEYQLQGKAVPTATLRY